MIGDIRKAKINDRIYDVTSFDEYVKNKELFDSRYTAIQDRGYILPVLNQFDTTPGIIIGSAISKYNLPDSHNEEYNDDRIIDFNDAQSIQEIINKQDKVRELEKEILTSPDNIFKPIIKKDDEPAMIALKEAVLEKNIDLDKYEPRFKNNYNNDKRLFNKSKISLAMITRMCDALDIKCTLTLEDKGPDIANPIGKQISIELTGGEEVGEE